MCAQKIQFIDGHIKVRRHSLIQPITVKTSIPPILPIVHHRLSEKIPPSSLEQLKWKQTLWHRSKIVFNQSHYTHCILPQPCCYNLSQYLLQCQHLTFPKNPTAFCLTAQSSTKIRDNPCFSNS